MNNPTDPFNTQNALLGTDSEENNSHPEEGASSNKKPKNDTGDTSRSGEGERSTTRRMTAQEIFDIMRSQRDGDKYRYPLEDEETKQKKEEEEKERQRKLDIAFAEIIAHLHRLMEQNQIHTTHMEMANKIKSSEFGLREMVKFLKETPNPKKERLISHMRATCLITNMFERKRTRGLDRSRGFER